MKAKKQLKKASKQYKALAKQYYDQQYELLIAQDEIRRLNQVLKTATVLN